MSSGNSKAFRAPWFLKGRNKRMELTDIVVTVE